MVTKALPLLKAKLGIMSDVRDELLKAILDGLNDELTNVQGLTLEETNNAHLMFLVDYAEFRYLNRSNPSMPRHLQWRLHNMMLGSEPDERLEP